MRPPHNNKRPAIYKSTFGDEVIRGTARYIAEQYEQKAKEAEINKDMSLRHSLLQHAEYYRKQAEQGA